jgi:mRNA-degrading endonuclease RelE of RelBE toxin-antitoxin system
MAWTVTVARSEVKALRRLPADVQDWVAMTIVELHQGPRAVNAAQLSSKAGKYFKVRHGDYRLVFEVLPEQVIDVALIDHRSRIYQRFASLK